MFSEALIALHREKVICLLYVEKKKEEKEEKRRKNPRGSGGQSTAWIEDTTRTAHNPTLSSVARWHFFSSQIWRVVAGEKEF